MFGSLFCCSCDPCRCECGIHVHTDQGSCRSGAKKNSLGTLWINVTVSIFPGFCWEICYSTGYAEMAVLIASFTTCTVCSWQNECCHLGSNNCVNQKANVVVQVCHAGTNSFSNWPVLNMLFTSFMQISDDLVLNIVT